MMKITPIFLGLILLIFLALPVLAASDGAGEENVTILDKEGKVVDNAVHVSDDDRDETSPAKDTDKEDSDGSDDSGDSDDVWGIKQSDAGWTDLVNINTLGGVYMGFTPFKNMSLLSISITGGLALTFLIVGIFGLLIWAGVGAAHPNIKKGWAMIRGAQGKIVAIGIVFALAFFMIIVIFFTLSIFGKVIVLMA